ncbi:MAG: hybrid sensor histidine kinase/response regulator [Sphingomonas bacterium]|nr:hybrid sensor histidine kinase/response regulator [Sphingomonas bacterium]
MKAVQRIVADERPDGWLPGLRRLEDDALRQVAPSARRWSIPTVGGTAFGAASFLAFEAIGATLTIRYGFASTAAATAVAMLTMFAIGLPIAFHAARAGLTSDLLTRGAGFGYLGATIPSLIRASFTLVLFAIDASILSGALNLLVGMPLWAAHLLSSLIVIPAAIYGMAALTRVQIATQPIWLALQIAPILYLLLSPHALQGGSDGAAGAGSGGVALLPFGLAMSVLLSLLPQIASQADTLRFLPAPTQGRRWRWWAALIVGGPGWVFAGGVKLMLGSALALFAIKQGLDANDPAAMFHGVYREMVPSPAVALALTGILIFVCQLRANAANAYSGSIAWSNVFSRLTHAHPGRGVWLLANVALAFVLMNVGTLRAIEGALVAHASFAAAWIGALAAHLCVSRPLGLAPAEIEYKRAHLFDINPVGVGAMLISLLVSLPALAGALGPVAAAFAPVIGLAVAFVAAPAIALATRSAFYVARTSTLPAGATLTCSGCGLAYARGDMASCPAHDAPICTLCCTLEARCHDLCKPGGRIADQATRLVAATMPFAVLRSLPRAVGQYAILFTLLVGAAGAILHLIYLHYAGGQPGAVRDVIGTTLWIVFTIFALLSALAAWLIVLAHQRRRTADRESAAQTALLLEEIEAHTRTDAALQKAKEAAEAASAAKSRYLAGVSHEIRSPLNAIYGYAQLLERDGSIPPQEAARVIRRSSEHLTNLVDGLLDISRIESGVLKLSRDVVPFPALLEQLVDMFRMQAEAKGIELRYTTSGRIPAFVRTDEKRLRQILINLLSNAIKYTREGHAALHVRYRSQIAEIAVSDSGIGIRPEDMERIFEPFDRGSMTEAKVQPGTGLGLAITRVLTRIMGGEVEAESRLGEGSRFVVRLMLAEPAQAPPDTARLRQISGYEGARRTVLLVDDDPAQLTVLQGLLRPLGLTVFCASNGDEGLALAARCPPDIALLDIQMPGMSGWELAAGLRAAHGPALRIVMVSANAHEFAAGGDGRSAHDAFVMKPVELEMLLDVLAVQLNLAWITGGVTPPAEEAAPVDQPIAGVGPYLAELKQLGKIGHIRGIRAKLDELERELPSSRPLVIRLRARVKAFDLKSYLKMLETQVDG